MPRALLQRRSSALGNPEWISVTSTLEGPEHQLCSIGFRFCALTKKFDEVQASNRRTYEVTALIDELAAVVQSIDALHTDCECFSLEAPIGPPLPDCDSGRAKSPSQQAAEDKHVQCAMLVAMQLSCCASARALSCLDSTVHNGGFVDVPAVLSWQVRGRFLRHTVHISQVYKGGFSKGRNTILMDWIFSVAHDEMSFQKVKNTV